MQSLEEKKQQNKVIIKTCYTTEIVYLIIRLLCMVLFLIGKCYPMVFVSLGSVVIYLILLGLLKIKKYYAYALMCGLEFIIYPSVATILVGFSSGFYLNIVAITIVSFFTIYFSIKERKVTKAVRFSIFSALVVLGLHINGALQEPPYLLDKWLSTALFGIHVVVVFSFIIAYLLIFTKYAMTLENKIKAESRMDQLTKVSNRHDLFNYLETIEDKGNYDLAIFDIDDFKKVNDTYGHVCGDFILRELANITKLNLYNSFLARYGGEEFVVIVKTDGEDDIAFSQLEKIRYLIENNDFNFEGRIVRITISIGIERFHEDISNERWNDLADEKLYQSKASGKNKITM